MHRSNRWISGLAGVVSAAAWLAAAAGLAAPCPSAAAQPAFDPAAPLPTDPRLVTGEFENGLRYVVMKHAVPPGRAAVWLHVSSGSFNETDAQRGIAHFLEHMAFNGSSNFPPGSVIDFFQALGLTFGRHQNASTSFDRTNFRLEMPDNTPETVDKALLFISDVAFNLTLPQEEIDKERGIILEEKRTRLGAQQRVQEAWLKRLAPGSLLGDRIPIGVEATINAVNQQDFRDYYRRWYVPSNMAVFMVADMETAKMVDMLRARFSAGAKSPRPADQPLGVAPSASVRGVVITDPELAQATVSIVRIDPPQPPVTTYGRARHQLVEQLGVIAVNRRLERKIAQGAFAGLRGGMSAGSIANAARLAQITATGEASRWEPMLAGIAAELQRARTFGFTRREIDDALREVLSQAEQAVQTDATRNAVAIMGSWDAALASGETLTSAQQDLDVLRALAPSVEPEHVREALAKGFDTSAVSFNLQCPAGPGVPTEEKLAELGAAALAATVEAETIREGAASLMATPPAPVALPAPNVHQATQVATWTLANGVTAHHRFNDYKKNEVTVTITLAGGELLETPENRGITDAAVQAWQRAATGGLPSTDVSDLLVGRKVSVGGFSQPDAVALSISGTPDDLETGFQLAHLLLTDPKLEQAAFDQWHTGQLQSIESAKKSPGRTVFKALAGTVFPKGETRVLPLTEPQVNALSRDAAQAWLTRLIAESPIEVAVVGDIDQGRAAQLLSTYLATLPKRPAIAADTYAAQRRLARPTGARTVREDVATETKQAQVVVGFYGVDSSNTRDTRLMAAAAQVLSTRAIQRIREQEALAYSPRFSSNPSSAYPGFGMFMCGAPTDPEKAERLAAVIAEMFAAFAAEGPTQAEVDTVKKQIANNLNQSMPEPGFWINRTRALAYRGQSLDDVATEVAFFESLTPAMIRECYAKYYGPDNLWTIITKPAR